MNKLLSSFVIGSAVAIAGSPLSAQAEQVPMDNPTWGYKITSLGDVGHETAYVFTNTTAAMTWTAPEYATSVELLVVGGGGAGGNNAANAVGGGGGGAGGFRHVQNQAVVSGQSYAITVGKGGLTSERVGGNSTFGTLVTANGGGRGGIKSAGENGGSGGGGSGTYAAGSGTSGQGNKGGTAAFWAPSVTGTGGGGGGAGSVGGSTDSDEQAGKGGAGISCAITGEDVVYCSGGGGGTDSNNRVGDNGLGGVGAGDGGDGAHPDGGDATGYGCGGGGAAGFKENGAHVAKVGGKGFQGVVIVRLYEHDWEWTEGQAPTCTEGGWSNGVCKIEGCTEETRVDLPPLGHDFSDGPVCKHGCGTCTVVVPTFEPVEFNGEEQKPAIDETYFTVNWGEGDYIAVADYTITLTPKDGALWRDTETTEPRQAVYSIVVAKNGWVVEPSVSALEWIVGQAPEDLAINLGQARHGEVACNRIVDDLFNFGIGDHEVIFVAGGAGFEEIAKTNVVKVIAEAVEIALTNEDGSPISAEDLSAGSTVVVNFTDNDNQDLVLSVAYGRYDKEDNFTHDPDTLEKAAEEKRDYDPEHFGGWDYFDPIALIEAGQKSYTYKIPVDFGKIYAKDWAGKTIPEKYMLPTDKIRFFLTPKNQTPMKSLTSVVATEPTRQFFTSTHLVDIKKTMPSMNDVKVAPGLKDTMVFEFFPDDMTDPTLVLNMYIGSDSKPYYNYRDSTKTSGSGYNKVIGSKTISTSAAYKWQVNCANGRGYANDTNVTETETDLPTTTRDSGYLKFHGVGTMGKIHVYFSDWSACQHYLMPSLGYNAKGDLVAGYYCSIVHKFFSSEGGMEFVAGPDDDTYHKDLLLDVPVRGMSELMSCHVHDWDMENVEVLEPATCTKKGKGQVACKVVGCPFPDARLAVEIDALGHAWGDWVIEKQPTCTEAGYRVRTCTREDCDHIGSPETNAIAKLPHQRIFVKEEGGKLHYACANCETAIVEDPAYGQTWDWLQTDGTGYIVTDYKPSFLATKIVSNVSKWTKTASNTQSCLYSDDISGTSGKFQLRLWPSGTISFYNWPYADDKQYARSEAKFDNAQVGSPFQHIAYQDRATFRSVTSESGANEHWADFTDATRRAGKPLVFFADLNANKADKVATAKVRGFKVYEVAGDVETLVHDYVPATKGGANAGLWDRVENKYWPANSSGFTTGKNQGLSITIR